MSACSSVVVGTGFSRLPEPGGALVPAAHRSVRVDVDLSAGGVDLACLEAVAVDFARRALGDWWLPPCSRSPRGCST